MALHPCMQYGPSGCEEHMLSISSADLQALFYFSSGAFSLLITIERAGEGDKEKRLNEF